MPVPVINPVHLYVRMPGKNCECTSFEIMVSNMVLEILKTDSCLKNCRESLNAALKGLGYELTETGLDRFAKYVMCKISKYRMALRKKGGAQGNTAREAYKNTWWMYRLNAEEVSRLPFETLNELTEENQRLRQYAEESQEKIEDQAKELFNLLVENRSIEQRIKIVEKDSRMEHHGKPFGEVSSKQKLRHLSMLRDRSSIALWFAESFNLLPVSLELREKTTNENVVVDFWDNKTESSIISEPHLHDGDKQASDSTGKGKKQASYESLKEEEKVKIRTLVQVLNKFSISLTGYHELTQINPSLPRSYIVEGCQNSLDKVWEAIMTPTPGPHFGAQVPFKVLLENQVRKYISNLNTPTPPSEVNNDSPIKVKIAGDGTALSRTSTLFVTSLSLLDNDMKVMSSLGNHAIACVKTTEDYENLKLSLKDVIRDVNDICDKGYIDVDGKRVNIEIYLGGDYKFLLMALGMKSATSNNSCILLQV